MYYTKTYTLHSSKTKADTLALFDKRVNGGVLAGDNFFILSVYSVNGFDLLDVSGKIYEVNGQTRVELRTAQSIFALVALIVLSLLFWFATEPDRKEAINFGILTFLVLILNTTVAWLLGRNMKRLVQRKLELKENQDYQKT